MGIRGRYVEEIELHLPGKEVAEEIRHFLESGDFYQTVWKGENCFCADYKGVSGMQSNVERFKRMYFFKSDYTDGVLHIEAWVRDGKYAETGITGKYNLMMKQPYLNQMISFEHRLLDKLPEDNELRKKNQENLNKLSKENKKTKRAVGLINVLAIIGLWWALYEVLVHLGILPF